MTSDETDTIIEEVLAVYFSNNDIRKIQEILDIEEEIEHHCHEQQKELKNIVQELTEQNNRKKKDLVRLEPLEEHEKRIQMLKRELNDLQCELGSKERISK
jgi:predicted  nucleic acid-binding Zn-ribbon protein